MLALVDSQVVDVTPVLVSGQPRVQVAGPDAKGRGRVVVSLGGRPIESGVQFFKMAGGDALAVDPRTGDFRIKKKASGTIRAIFSGQHEDMEIAG